MKKIVCFGEALIDFLGEPAIPGKPRVFLQHAGGAPANVAAAVAKLGGVAEFVGMLGADMFGDFLLESFCAMKVGTKHIRRTKAAPTALAFVSLDAHGERSFSFYRPPAADLLFRDSDFDQAVFVEADILHVCSNSMTEAAIAHTTLSAMRRARGAGALVSFDMNLRPGLWARDTDPVAPIRAALAAADIVKLSDEEFAFLIDEFGDEKSAFDALWQGITQLVIVTHGADPLCWYTPQRQGVSNTFDVRATDTTAAGDAFVGGLLFKLAALDISPANFSAFLADEKALKSTLRFATACGALAVTRSGAFAAMPSLEDVQTLLEKHDA